MPTFPQVIARAEDQLAEFEGKARRLRSDAMAIRDTCSAAKRSATPAERTEMRDLLNAADSLDVRITRAKKELEWIRAEKAESDLEDEQARNLHDTGSRVPYGTATTIGSEVRTYSAHAARTESRSFFGDLYRAELRGDYVARERLARHAQEAQVEGEMTARALATGGLAGLVPPAYLVADYAAVLRSGRPTANLLRTEPLPEVGMTFQIPRGTTGASVAVQASENATISTTDEVWSNVSVPVVSIAGYAAVSRQSLERGTPGVDQIIFSDLVGAYAAAQDQQVLSGTGSSGQMLGILSTGGITQMSAFTAAATATTFSSKLAGAIASIAGAGANVRPRAIVMHPRRWGWLSLQVDTTGRPLISPVGAGPVNAVGISSDPGGYGAEANFDAHANVVGFIQGLPVITDANVPTSVGTGPEDQVIVLDSQAAILWQDNDGMPQTVAFEQTASTSMQVTLVCWGYSAMTAGRYPAAISVIGGNAGTAGYGLTAVSY